MMMTTRAKTVRARESGISRGRVTGTTRGAGACRSIERSSVDVDRARVCGWMHSLGARDACRGESSLDDAMAPMTRAGCCAGAPRADEHHEPSGARAETSDDGDGDERALTRKFTRLGTKLKSAPVVLTSTRARGDGDEASDDVDARDSAGSTTRASASARWRSAKTKVHVIRRMTTTTSERLAALLKEKIEYELASESERRAKVESDKGALDSRLARLGMRRVAMDGDGNCQFRSIAHNVFKDQERHAEVRALATAHIEERKDDFQIYFEDARTFKRWLVGMKRDRTWGDELTLRAAVDALGMRIHVVQSTEQNWYLLYEPEEQKTKRSAFISYVSPVHYDALAER